MAVGSRAGRARSGARWTGRPSARSWLVCGCRVRGGRSGGVAAAGRSCALCIFPLRSSCQAVCLVLFYAAGWRGIDILGMACRVAGLGRSLAGRVGCLFVFGEEGSRSGRYWGCRRSWAILAELHLLLMNWRMFVLQRRLAEGGNRTCKQD